MSYPVAPEPRQEYEMFSKRPCQLLVRLDDVITVLFVCRRPVTLRSLSRVGEYEVVGVSYIHGVMLGEAIGAHEAAVKASDVFHPR